ncbi:MAG: hypothetical protein ACYCPS_04600 [Candidatus Saccharimonadales bacterium]
MTDNISSDKFKLPSSIAMPVDIGHIQRELNLIDEHLNQAAIKDPTKVIVVKTSAKLTELLSLNKLDIDVKSERSLLISILENLRKTAPVVNISFSTEATDEFIQKIADWFRQQVHPNCLVVVGLDPNIGLGAVVRTSNKVFDFTLKHQLESTRDVLVDRIKKLNTEVV